MAYVGVYQEEAVYSQTFSDMAGDVVLEFGNGWCGHCQRAQSAIEAVLSESSVAHLKVADGRDKRLGRAYKVKLWPTLIRVVDGKEVARVVRPVTAADVSSLFTD